MKELSLTLATILGITPIDVFVLGACTIVWIGILIGWLQKIYEMYFGLVVGLAIYLMLTVLLSPQYQTPDTIKILSPGFSGFLISSSAYLIFILFFLTPIVWGIRFPQTRSLVLRIGESVGVATTVIAVFLAIVLGLANKTYIFGIETGFLLLRKLSIYPELVQGKIVGYIVAHIQPIVLFSVLFLLYKILFSEIVGAILRSVWQWLMSLRNKKNAPEEHHATEESHDSFEMEDEHGHHEDHGHEESHGHWHGGHH